MIKDTASIAAVPPTEPFMQISVLESGAIAVVATVGGGRRGPIA
jgi:hypothetical protein